MYNLNIFKADLLHTLTFLFNTTLSFSAQSTRKDKANIRRSQMVGSSPTKMSRNVVERGSQQKNWSNI